METSRSGRKSFFNYVTIAAICLVSVLIISFTLQMLVFSSATARPKMEVAANLTETGGLIGSELYENNSFPFQAYAQTSQILALPVIASWLNENNYTVNDLRPYVSMYPFGGNPSDFSQGTAVENGTTYLIYEYLIVNSPVGLVMGTWVTSNSTVAKIFTYDTCGPNIVDFGLDGSPLSNTAASPPACPTDVP